VDYRPKKVPQRSGRSEEEKKKGYAIDSEEYTLGVRSIVAPLQTNSLLPAAI